MYFISKKAKLCFHYVIPIIRNIIFKFPNYKLNIKSTLFNKIPREAGYNCYKLNSCENINSMVISGKRGSMNFRML